MPTLPIIIDARQARAEAQRAASEIDKLKRGVRDTGIEIDRTERRSKTLAGTWALLGKAALAFGVSLSSVLLVRSTLRTLVEFERGLVGVGKTADLEGEALRKFGDEIVRLSMELASTNQLLEIAQAAGQLGVKGTKDILLFTETVVKLGSASNLAGEQAATTLARILNVTGEGMDKVKLLGSVIVALGNNSAATESEIADMTTRIAQSTVEFGMSSAQVAGLGAALVEMGVQAEAGGTAVGRTMRGLDAAIREGGAAMNQLQQLTGKTGEELERLRTQDPLGLFTEFALGLQRVVQQGGSVAQVIEVFGLQGERILAVLPTIALRSERLAQKMAIVNAELENTVALDNEAAKAFATLGARWELFKNTIEAVKLQLRDSNGTLADFVDSMAAATRIMFGMATEADALDKRAILLANTIKLLGLLFGSLITIQLAKWFYSAGAAVVMFTKNLFAARTATTAFGASLLGVVAVLGSAAASFEFGRYIYERFDSLQKFMADTIAGIKLLWVDFKAWWQSLWVDISDTIDSVTGMAPGERDLNELMARRRILQSYIERKFQETGDTSKIPQGDEVFKRIRELDTQIEEHQKLMTSGEDDLLGTNRELLRIEQERLAAHQRIGEELAAHHKLIEQEANFEGTFTDFLTRDIETLLPALESLSQKLFGVTPAVQDLEETLDDTAEASDEATTAVEETTEAVEGLSEAAQKARDQLDKVFDQMRTRNEELKFLKSGDKVGSEMVEFSKLVGAGEFDESEANAKLAALREEIELRHELEKKIQKNEDDERRLNQLTMQGAEGVVGALENIIFEMQSLEDAAESAARALAKMFFEAAVGDPLKDAISMALRSYTGSVMSSARGNLFSGGHIVNMARGGFLNAPTEVPLATGDIARAGEAGQEVVMPVTRDAAGNAAVHAVGAAPTLNVTQNFNFSGGSPNDQMRRSSRQVAAASKRVIDRAFENR